MLKLISIGVGGFFGAISRYLITGEVNRYAKGIFPYGTLVVNLIGCFLLGFLLSLSLQKDIIPPTLRTAVTTGFLGALTTFSTFTYETIVLLEGKNLLLALGNMFVSLLLGLALGFLGVLAGRTV